MISRIFTPTIFTIVFVTLCSPGYSDTKILTRESDGGTSVIVTLETGKHWKHTLMRVVGVIPIKTTPQIAVWIEGENGDFLKTLYITERYATQNWRKAPGDTQERNTIRRPQALPYWEYKHTMFTGNSSVSSMDAVSAASPKVSFTLASRLGDVKGRFAVLVEINNSTDFNEYFPRDAAPGDEGYTGGKFGGGQPSLVYKAVIDTEDAGQPVSMTLIGHGNPNGDDGWLYTDLSTITTAREIVSRITATVSRKK